jgi:hypothetical protein
MAMRRTYGLAAWAWLGFLALPAQGQVTRYVSLAGSHTAPYTNWATAATNLQAAVSVSAAGNLILVTNGTYQLSATVSVTNSITLRGFNGPAVTIVDGRDTVRCFSLSGGAALQGLTLQRGRASGSGAAGYGAGVYANNARISNCVIRLCVASGRGGGIYFFTGGGLVTHSRLENNDSPYGGGVHCRNVGTVSNCVLTGNRALGAAGTGGGGVYTYQGGTVAGCWLQGNTAGNDGGGVLMETAGLTRECVLIENTAGDWGGGLAVYFANAVARNSLMAGNSADEGGGVYLYRSGTLQNCTVAGNHALLDGGGVFFDGGGTSVNSIVYFNEENNAVNLGSGMGYRYTCVTPAPSGAPDLGGNFADDPAFLYRSEYALRLLPGSPCINTGTNETWTSADSDLAGMPRILDGTVDVGAYEFGPLACHFTGTPLLGSPPFAVTFDSFVTGTNLNSLFYRWDAQNDGLDELQGVDSNQFTHVYTTGGLFSVRLSVSNAAADVATQTRTNYVLAYLPHYVATNGGHVTPFLSWADAATSLYAAVEVAEPGGLVVVSNGLYRVNREVAVTQALRIASVNGPLVTRVQATGTSRVFGIRSGVSLAGFHISGGLAGGADEAGYGGGVFLNGGGLVSNCVIAGNRAAQYGGGACLLYGGTLMHSAIQTNVAALGGGAACYQGGLVLNCAIGTNYAGNRGGGAYGYGNSLIRNSVLEHNAAATNGGGVAFFSSGGTLQNCTVVSNTANRGGGLLCEDGGNVQNSIVYFNTGVAGNPNWFTNTAVFNYGAFFRYACLTPTTGLPSATACFTNDPLFTSVPGTPFYPDAFSPCVNRGEFASWMTTAFDLLGTPRIVGGAVDIGAFERMLLALAITNTASGIRFPFSRLSTIIAGTLDGVVGSVHYTNAYPGGVEAGSFPAASNWSFSVRLPRPGWQNISVSGANAVGQVAVDFVVIRRNKNPLFILPAR